MDRFPESTAGGGGATAELSRRKTKKAQKQSQKIKLPPGSLDAMVQHTNDDSAVSKRSAVACGYFKDPFARYFVRKPTRRSPLVNQGYHLRMVVMTDLVGQCIDFYRRRRGVEERQRECPVQVISLGAGYDTLALRLLLLPLQGQQLEGDAGADGVQFCDVDFPAVARAKAALMEAAPPGTFPAEWRMEPSSGCHPVESPQYRVLGVDLRDGPSVLVSRLQESGAWFSLEAPTVLYAECVMQYMPPEGATALLRGVAQHFRDAIFIAYDQIHPHDSFGNVMVRALKQKGSPLLSIMAAPNGAAMVARAVRAGMAHASFANFHSLARFYLCGAERRRVDSLEPFDEMEEWSEMCEHYGITLAGTSALSKSFTEAHTAFQDTPPCDPLPAPSSSVPVRHRPWPSGRFGFEGWGNGEVFAVAHPQTGERVLIGFGGFTASTAKTHHQRENRVFAHALRGGEMRVHGATRAGGAPPPPPMVFHSVSQLAPDLYVIFGGRASPTEASNAAYLLRVSVSSELAVSWDLLLCTDGAASLSPSPSPSPRYRHTAVALSSEAFFIFGGRDAHGELLHDAWVAEVKEQARTIRWHPVSLHGTCVPPPRCSAAAVLDPHEGQEVLLCGGLLADSQCCSTLWRIHPATGKCSLVRSLPGGGRFSHTMTCVSVDGSEQVLVLGGCGCGPRVNIPPALLLDTRLETVQVLALPEECPTWARHSCVALGSGVVAVVGGGYTCFSFGTFAARPCLLELGHAINPLLGSTETLGIGGVVAADTHAADYGMFLLSLPRPAVMEYRGTFHAEDFARVAQDASRPVVFRGVPLGACVERWADSAYLKEAERDTVVSVHVSKGLALLDFVRKNFSFTHVPFQDLVEHAHTAACFFKQHRRLPEECWYYRSIATHMKSERANLWKDFRTLGADFSLPQGVEQYVLPRLHQSCLRINAPPLQVWTHYDTLDNVLCQIVGRKRVVLFPPSQYGNLYMMGSSSPILDIDAPDLLQYPRFVEACKHALEVVLEPGDMLYFPANWFHHITTLEEERAAPTYSVSVNVFFQHFDPADYDRKDLYGNKDVPAVTELRQSIVALTKEAMLQSRLGGSGKPLPPEYVEFALRLALQDLEGVADSLHHDWRG